MRQKELDRALFTALPVRTHLYHSLPCTCPLSVLCCSFQNAFSSFWGEEEGASRHDCCAQCENRSPHCSIIARLCILKDRATSGTSNVVFCLSGFVGVQGLMGGASV
jgi:hypothetical protein